MSSNWRLVAEATAATVGVLAVLIAWLYAE